MKEFPMEKGYWGRVDTKYVVNIFRQVKCGDKTITKPIHKEIFNSEKEAKKYMVEKGVFVVL